MGLLSDLRAGGESSISFDKTKYKLGDKATGKWKVDDGFQIVDSKSTEHLSKPNIPHKNGPSEGKFEVDTLKYSKSVNDAKVFMMLKDKNTGATEKENNALRSSCTIVGIEGEISGVSVFPFALATIYIKAIGMPKTLGKITNLEISKISIETEPPTPFKFSSSGNPVNEEEVFAAINAAAGKRNFNGAHVIATLRYDEMLFTAQGVFTGSIGERNLRATFK